MKISLFQYEIDKRVDLALHRIYQDRFTQYAPAKIRHNFDEALPDLCHPQSSIKSAVADAVIEAHQGENATSEGMDIDSVQAQAETADVAEEQAAEAAEDKSIEEIASES